jgi:anti-sigma B factor antagonist
MDFDCTSETLPGAVVVTPSGEIDRDTAPQLREILERAVRQVPGGLVEVEMGDVTFMDSSGIGALLAGHRLGGSIGATVRIRHCTRPVRSVLEMTNVWHLLTGADPA